MRFLVITLAPTLLENNQYYSYGPYVKEMNLWFSYIEHVTIVSPTIYTNKLLKAPFLKNDLEVVSIPAISFGTISSVIKSIVALPIIIIRLFKEMKKADHIHLRCPATITLIASVVQLFFPKKKKTAKYAGNWDPKAKQPISYKLQKWILSTTFLTRNMSVLVYGDWLNQSKNIIPFFTATYKKEQIPRIKSPTYNNSFRIIFVGSLVSGKRPLYAIEFVKKSLANGIDVQIDFYGEGNQRPLLEKYIIDHKLHDKVILHGNQSTSTIIEAYKKSHFLLLPSKSEGWPKVVAEAMFWGVIPIVTPISCVPWMVKNKGLLLLLDVHKDVIAFAKAIKAPEQLKEMSIRGQEWSHKYTLDAFENSIKELL